MTEVPEVVLAHHCQLGEGPAWDETAQRLIFVDILGECVHRFDPATDEFETVLVGRPVGAAVPRAGGGIALAAGLGFLGAEFGNGELVPLADVPEERVAGARMNDGKCDPQGRFWAGTQSDEPERRAGVLYRLEADGTVTPIIEGVGISNGLDWSCEGETFYYIDTASCHIDAFDFDAAAGTLDARRTLVTVPRSVGLADGMTVDSEGGLWVAMFGGGAVHRYSNEGMLEAVVRFPVSLVTSCAFGGPDLKDLYVTTAAHRLSRPEPLAGSLFCFRPGVTGRTCARYGG
jgi:sugar lactone lactonase YvrE